MSDPRFAYVASPYSLKELRDRGGHGGSSCTLYLDPSEAVHALFASLWNEIDEDFVANGYQVQLDHLDGVWPRVGNVYNDSRPKCSCSYRGRIPTEALRWVSATRADNFVLRGKNRYPWS